MKQIIITIKPDGTREVKAEGIKGQACDKVLAPLIAKLGPVLESKKTPEWNQDVVVNQNVG
jgi:hypothetical protein